MHSQRSLPLLCAVWAISGLLATAIARPAKDPVFLTIDHASLCGSNLEAMRQALASVGLSSEYGGPHASGGTHMALVGFDDGSYLELIAPQSSGSGSDWAKLMADDAGPCAWAVEAKDMRQEISRLRDLDVQVEGPRPGSRKRPDGMAIEWEVAKLGPGTPGSLLPFLIQDRTPREWRVTPSGSLSGSFLSGVEVVVLAVRDLSTSIELFRRVYNWAPPVTTEQKDFQAKLAYFPGQPVMLASPLSGKSWLAARLQKFGQVPAAYLLATGDYGSAAKKLHLTESKPWFEQHVGWLDRKKLNGMWLGVIGR